MSEMAAPEPQRSFLDRYFKLAENGTTLRRETFAGLKTFIAMSYIIFVK